ncbi:MAG: DNA polymerase III subunit gamma/tau [Oscillospiraceae bacterium]|nr:DNA polymerase III subunit gamma/tau [Oscillospiraceae bacterium]
MYTALYRKWRPKTFDDVIAQPHITTTLKSQITNGKTAHAYLFTGSRGTGKTTCARIFAKAINCENSADGNPCLSCSVCVDAENEALSDIIEIDAASNNGVDDIRDLRDGAVYSPERCRYKVYIIDEVHMLSVNAFNALLKIIEEPPPYVKFVLATTEVHKVLPTILSRCQRFDFRRIMPEDIAKRLLYIAGEEKINLSEEAALLIARLADGGMRDALSLLDQCIAYSTDVTLETVSAASGIAGRDYLFDIIESVVRGDTSTALTITDKLYAMSKDITRLCEELILQFRNIMLIKSVPERKELIACLPSEQERLSAIASSLSIEDILSKLTVLQECNERLSRSLAKRVEFEMCLVKLCTLMGAAVSIPKPKVTETPQQTFAEPASAPLTDKFVPPVKEEPKPQPVAETKTEKPKPEPVKAEPSKQEPVKEHTVKQSDPSVDKPVVCNKWADVLEEFKKVDPAVAAALIDSYAFINTTTIFIVARNSFFMKLFAQEENKISLIKVITKVLGKSYIVRAKSENKELEDKPDDYRAVELLGKAKENGIPTGTE